MGLQLIFVVETDMKCKSDWIYIKDTIDCFYQYDQTQVKLSPVYMNGKGNYKKKEKEILKLISQYRAVSPQNQSQVIYCFDCDDYDSKQADFDFLKNIREYCKKQHADFIWFCKDIESVYLGRRITKIQKKKESVSFKAKKQIVNVDTKRLCAAGYQMNTSNIMSILDQYFKRK